MTHACPECGLEHGSVATEETEEHEAEVVTEAAVEIAKVEADRDITLAKIAAKSDEGWQEARIAELEGKLAGMQEILSRVAPTAPTEESEENEEPEVVVVEQPTEEPMVGEETSQAPEEREPSRQPRKRTNPWW